ncbi:hypothetical protein J5X84_20260 [Streptosporangiaceae bacterium NEAU-GS5]|nr:hypothetical protein [Streptosporangiaceae bacterium NEAU-GS5]
MSLSRAEIPNSGGDGGNEALPRITKLNRGLYTLVFYILGIALILLILGWILITALNRPVPDALPVVIGTIVGGLVAVITSDKPS